MASSQKLNQRLIERHRFDLPNPFPLHRDITFPGKALARLTRLFHHPREGGGIEMALIKRDSTFFDYAGDDPRFR
jgi:hypothetical protein